MIYSIRLTIAHYYEQPAANSPASTSIRTEPFTPHTETFIMLDSIIKFSLRYRMLVVVISLVVLVYGSYLATQMSIDVFPDLDRPRVVIITEAPGLATEEVETLVTQPIEIALMGANGVQAVRSQSTSGLNIIFIEFDWSTEIRAARQTVQERLTTLEGILPAGIRPQMTPPSSIMGQIIIAGIYRQDGPHGGKLAQVGTTNLMAEMIEDNGKTPRIDVWRPGDRHDFATWEKLDPQSVGWSTSDESTTGTATIQINERTYEANFYSDAKQQYSGSFFDHRQSEVELGISLRL